jgi:acetyltransferase-like isoleucine patch superfamily enzyme
MIVKMARRFGKRLLFQPRLGTFGTGTRVDLPREINNPKLIHVGARTHIRHSSIINAISEYAGAKYNPIICFGDDMYIGRHCQFHAIDSIKIGRGTVLSDFVYMSDNSHGFIPSRGQIMEQSLSSKGPINIGNNCFIGIGTTILANISLGDWCVVGARSLVTTSFPAYCMVAGNPARIIKKFSADKNSWVSTLDGNRNEY